MALPPGGIQNSSEGDKKRLLQRADSFAIGSAGQRKQDLEELDEFGEAMETVLKKSHFSELVPDDQSDQLEKHREHHAKMEGERRGSSSPSHQPFLGLSILPGISNQPALVGQAPENESQRKSGHVKNESENLIESVSMEIVKGLRAAGLSEPIVTLDDPRLGSSADRLNEHFVMSLRDSERVYVWSGNSCHQILSIGMHESQLESAVGTTVEIVKRRGKIDEKSVHQRHLSESEFFLDSDDD